VERAASFLLFLALFLTFYFLPQVKALKEPERDRKKVKHVKHSGNISLDEIIDIARQMQHKSMSKSLAGGVKVPSLSAIPTYTYTQALRTWDRFQFLRTESVGAEECTGQGGSAKIRGAQPSPG